MTIGEVLHPFVPSLIVTELYELLEQYRAVLAGDGRNGAIRGAVTG